MVAGFLAFDLQGGDCIEEACDGSQHGSVSGHVVGEEVLYGTLGDVPVVSVGGDGSPPTDHDGFADRDSAVRREAGGCGHPSQANLLHHPVDVEADVLDPFVCRGPRLDADGVLLTVDPRDAEAFRCDDVDLVVQPVELLVLLAEHCAVDVYCAQAPCPEECADDGPCSSTRKPWVCFHSNLHVSTNERLHRKDILYFVKAGCTCHMNGNP